MAANVFGAWKNSSFHALVRDLSTADLQADGYSIRSTSTYFATLMPKAHASRAAVEQLLSRSFAWPWIYCPVWAAFAGGETGPQLWPKQHPLQANLAVYRHGMQIAARKGGEPSG